MDEGASQADIRIKLLVLDAKIEEVRWEERRLQNESEQVRMKLEKEICDVRNDSGEDLMVEAQFVLECGTKLMELAGQIKAVEDHKQNLLEVASARFDGCPL